MTRVRLGVSGGMRLDFAHGVAVKEPLTAVRAFVKFQIGDHVALAFKFAREVAAHSFEFIAAAGGAFRDFSHVNSLLPSAFGGKKEVKRFDSRFADELAFCVNG